jgi:hypothetical protein
MRGIRNLTGVGLIGALVLAASLTASFASARQGDFLGHFTLTSETRWGQAVLPAGRYTFELDLTHDLITVRGQHRAAMIMSATHDTDTRVKLSALILVSRRGKATVRALQLARDNVVLLYAVPKETREELAQGPTMIQRVPVTINGK